MHRRLLTGAPDEAHQRETVQRVPVEQVLPVAPLIGLGSALQALAYAELSDADRAAILGGNMEKLLAPSS